MGKGIEKDIFPRRFGCAYNQAASERFFAFTGLQAEGQAIQFRVLGCAGGKAPGCQLTSFLINEELLLEGGSAASGLTIEEQAKLTGVLVSHAHLDHIAELPYLADNIFGLRDDSLKIIGARDVLEQISKIHLQQRRLAGFLRDMPRRYTDTRFLRHRGDGNPAPATGFG